MPGLQLLTATSSTVSSARLLMVWSSTKPPRPNCTLHGTIGVAGGDGLAGDKQVNQQPGSDYQSTHESVSMASSSEL